MKYQRKSFTVPVQVDQDNPKAADLDEIFGRKKEMAKEDDPDYDSGNDESSPEDNVQG
jgi:hypothetical protein